MSAPVPAASPVEVTIVLFTTWIVAVLTVLGGLMILFSSDHTLSEAGVSASTAQTIGWIEIGLGVVIGGVARSLGDANNAARVMITIVMAVRILWAVWTMVTFIGSSLFWSAALAAGLALIVIVLLWTSSANAYFAPE